MISASLVRSDYSDKASAFIKLTKGAGGQEDDYDNRYRWRCTSHQEPGFGSLICQNGFSVLKVLISSVGIIQTNKQHMLFELMTSKKCKDKEKKNVTWCNHQIKINSIFSLNALDYYKRGFRISSKYYYYYYYFV